MTRAGDRRTSGGTGRRTGFRFRRRKACGFDSRLVHLVRSLATSLFGACGVAVHGGAGGRVRVRAGHPAPPSGCRRGRGVSFRRAQGVPGQSSGKVQAEKYHNKCCRSHSRSRPEDTENGIPSRRLPRGRGPCKARRCSKPYPTKSPKLRARISCRSRRLPVL